MVFLTQFIALLVKMELKKKNYLVGQSGYDFKKLQTCSVSKHSCVAFYGIHVCALEMPRSWNAPTEASSAPRARSEWLLWF